MDEIRLSTGKVYRGRMIVTTPIEIFPKHVIPPLEEVGFEGVKVWFNSEQLPSDWPEDKKNDLSDFGEVQVWLEGVWSGKDDQVAPSSGDKWVAYDIWEKGGQGQQVVYGKRKTTLGSAMYVGAWTLGTFLFGLPIVLAMNAEKKRG